MNYARNYLKVHAAFICEIFFIKLYFLNKILRNLFRKMKRTIRNENIFIKLFFTLGTLSDSLQEMKRTIKILKKYSLFFGIFDDFLSIFMDFCNFVIEFSIFPFFQPISLHFCQFLIFLEIGWRVNFWLLAARLIHLASKGKERVE